MIYFFTIVVTILLINFVIPTVFGKIIGYRNLTVLRGTKLCFLTFDDGPSKMMTSQILEVLKNHDIKATFFLSGRSAMANPAIAEKIFLNGHAIGVHGFNHIHAWKNGPIRSFRDAVKGEAAIRTVTGATDTILFRPPYGKFNLGTLLYIILTGKILILWDVDSKDFTPQPVKEIINRVQAKIGPGQILLFHDGGPEGEPKASNTPIVVEETIKREAGSDLVFGALKGLRSEGFGLCGF